MSDGLNVEFYVFYVNSYVFNAVLLALIRCILQQMEEMSVNADDDLKLAVTVGAAIAARRKQKGLTQSQFAEFIDVTQDSLSRMEKGSIAPKFSRLQRIADGLGCSVADLFRKLDDSAREKAERMADKISPLSPELQDLVVEFVEKTVEVFKNKP